MLGQTLPGGPGSATVRLSLAGAVGTRAGLVVLGETYAWVGLELTEDGPRLVCRTGGASPLEEQLAEPEPAPATVELRVDWEALVLARRDLRCRSGPLDRRRTRPVRHRAARHRAERHGRVRRLQLLTGRRTRLATKAITAATAPTPSPIASAIAQVVACDARSLDSW